MDLQRKQFPLTSLAYPSTCRSTMTSNPPGYQLRSIKSDGGEKRVPNFSYRHFPFAGNRHPENHRESKTGWAKCQRVSLTTAPQFLAGDRALVQGTRSIASPMFQMIPSPQPVVSLRNDIGFPFRRAVALQLRCKMSQHPTRGRSCEHLVLCARAASHSPSTCSHETMGRDCNAVLSECVSSTAAGDVTGQMQGISAVS